MLKLRRYLLWIPFLFSLSACNETIEFEKDKVSEDNTSLKVNWRDSLSNEEVWLKGSNVQGHTGSTMLGDLATMNLDSSAISDYKMESRFQGFIPDSKLERFHYPLRSSSGGSVDGFYDSSELIRIESIFLAEFGYSSINVDYQNGEIKKINYHQHFADYAKYSQDFPELKSVDPEKLSYTDTTYLLELGSIKSSKKYAGKKIVSTEIKEGLVEHLIDCAKKMKSELSYERESAIK